MKRVLGDSLPGVLVTDFYAAYHALDCRKQKCLAHLLRELHTLREQATAAAKDNYLQPLMTLLPDAIALGHTRSTLAAPEFADARQRIENRLDTLIFTRPTDKDCRRINPRLVRHRLELLCFLEVAGVPPDIPHAAQDESFNRVGIAPRVIGNPRSKLAGRCPRG